jgi:phage host-nuclease inhibitor protein Gam
MVDELEAYLQSIDAPHMLNDGEPQCPPDPWVIANELQADRLLRRLRDEEADQRTREAAAEAEIAKIRAWVTSQRERMERRTAYLRASLEQFMRIANARAPRVKTMELPSGTLALRKRPPQWRYPEREEELQAALDFARARGEVRVTVKADGLAAVLVQDVLREKAIPHTAEEALDKAGLKKILDVRDGVPFDPHTGEVLPGVTVEDGAVEFYLRANE